MDRDTFDMRVLVADDDDVVRLLVTTLLRGHGYRVENADNGKAAWEILRGETGPKIALVNWFMPDIDGIELCRAVRGLPDLAARHMILLTSKSSPENIVQGLRAGANDYVTKPFNKDELLARVEVGAKIMRLQAELKHRVDELQTALMNVKQLQGLLPICSYCKSVRNDSNYWQRVEDYLADNADVRCSHGVCPGCWDKVVKPEFALAGIPLPEACPQPSSH